MSPNQTLAKITASIFTDLDPILEAYKPDWILAQGDTTTVMATSILAYYHRIRFGHVEAGLRTYDKWQPFPEEINRKIAGCIADLHFAPTEWSRDNLLREAIPAEKIVVTGNTVIDALQQIARLPADAVTNSLVDQLGLSKLPERRLILMTAHRRENFGQPLVDICQAVLQLVDHYGDAIRVIYPVHLNPNVRQTVYPLLDNHPGILLTDPLDYLPMVHMLKHASLVLTDSGGLQEEAPSLGVPVLVMREVTERPEGIHAGTVRLVGTDTGRIVAEARRLLDDQQAYAQMAQAVNPYGDGNAAPRIVKAILAAS